MMRLMAMFDAAPSSVEFAHRRGRDDAEALAAKVGQPVKLGAPRCCLWIPRPLLGRQSPLSDPALHAFFIEQITSAFGAEARDDVVRAVHDVVAARLGRASVEVEQVARLLGASPRTLQRRLDEAGTSYRDVLDLVRHQRAAELVLVEELSIADIAERIGYDDPAVFTRAFKRWTGRSPRDHRRGS
jgi:AraC-like DNA-binding protein